eukprot:5254196-Prymnesium_polylepis.2
MTWVVSVVLHRSIHGAFHTFRNTEPFTRFVQFRHPTATTVICHERNYPTFLWFYEDANVPTDIVTERSWRKPFAKQEAPGRSAALLFVRLPAIPRTKLHPLVSILFNMTLGVLTEARAAIAALSAKKSLSTFAGRFVVSTYDSEVLSNAGVAGPNGNSQAHLHIVGASHRRSILLVARVPEAVVRCIAVTPTGYVPWEIGRPSLLWNARSEYSCTCYELGAGIQQAGAVQIVTAQSGRGRAAHDEQRRVLMRGKSPGQIEAELADSRALCCIHLLDERDRGVAVHAVMPKALAIHQ